MLAGDARSGGEAVRGPAQTLIGEAVDSLARNAPSTAEQITGYPRIIAFRNILIHRYSQVDHEIVWDITQSYLPTLITEVTTLLDQP